MALPFPSDPGLPGFPGFPGPRVPPAPEHPPGAGGPSTRSIRWAHWYEQELGWKVTGGTGGVPLQLPTGQLFDVLELPAAAGRALLEQDVTTGPVALAGTRVRLWVAAGSAEELDGLLDWLEWSGIALDLTAHGAGGRICAPMPPGLTGGATQGAAVWLRPPEPGCEAALPTLAPVGRGGGGLVRLVGAVASECLRHQLRRTTRPERPGRPAQAVQPLAFS
ncbi:SCO3374 family protein [Streptomyces sp. NPDC006879]|uniref:SCO3374 family protein n=1 Tax=Streptomyces sp. NPDC006879 TaxID=3364767 RepID=UPI00367D4330